MNNPADTPFTSAPADRPVECDTSRRYVKVLERRADGQVLFEFAIGWPDLSVELMLPQAAFTTFCETNRVIRLDN